LFKEEPKMTLKMESTFIEASHKGVIFYAEIMSIILTIFNLRYQHVSTVCQDQWEGA
jgi:hypothetical protein